MVSVEEGSVNLNSFNSARCDTQLDDGVVEWLLVMSSSLPTVVPSACEYHLAWLSNWGSGVQEVGSLTEPLV